MFDICFNICLKIRVLELFVVISFCVLIDIENEKFLLISFLTMKNFIRILLYLKISSFIL